MKLPFVLRSYADQLERQISYRDTLIDRLTAERDEAVLELRRMVDNALMGIGQAPVSSEVRRDLTGITDEEAQKISEALANVDAETRVLNEAAN